MEINEKPTEEETAEAVLKIVRAGDAAFNMAVTEMVSETIRENVGFSGLDAVDFRNYTSNEDLESILEVALFAVEIG
jgi:hypothetical protein